MLRSLGVVDDSGRALQYQNDTLRPNIHVAVHFPEFAEEYALPVNRNTPIGENLHRYFKIRVYETNYSNVEKILLMKVNFQETMRLLLQNAFQHDDPELTSEMLALYQQCPTLFNKVLSRTDRNEMDALLENEDHEMEIDQSADSNHLRPAAINRIPTKSVVATHPINDGNRIPTRSGDLNTTSTWRGHLRLAYQYDYGKPAQYPSLFENRPIQWSRKFGFTDRKSNDRFTFRTGDFVRFKGDNQTLFGRVDHIFVLDNDKDRHIFTVLTLIKRTKTRHKLLDLEIMEETEDAVVVGVPVIRPVRLYMVPVRGVGIIWVNWDIHAL
ncbi:hypothetical protein CHGG_05421 [Chaetomium globosum CBS 148.51]|uniref:Uncharacterized protein n=1 Tax=Chaetomium globosum (strain ATCC 6205 / CBS 148.51 / DSM 1962 / NBRC 6347 / NRRL 1970) TaxID=306901 RepID=Q2H7E4_CHAGB|nr:uncharacterized protein CHGG_05421 [Chaetomium globosum CBS 148.51]EAQ88802.1 hypothetical protein CHGG_05421 [Chaetomium globosum CBS 148.51]